MHTSTIRTNSCNLVSQADRPFVLDHRSTPRNWPDLLTRNRLRQIVADMID